jgi:hypothetical protein
MNDTFDRSGVDVDVAAKRRVVVRTDVLSRHVILAAALSG